MSNNEVTVGEFAKKVTAFAEDYSNDVKDGKAALIIIGVDASQDDHNSAVVGVIGKNALIVEGLAKFYGVPEHFEIMQAALHLASVNKLKQAATSLCEIAGQHNEKPIN